MEANVPQRDFGAIAGTRDTLMSVPEQEHPAAKAGRFVRAAGLAISSTLEKQAAKAPPAPPKAPPAPPRASPPPTPPPVAKVPPAPPPPPVPTRDFVGRAIFLSFIVSLFAFLVVVLRVEMLFTSTPKTVLQLVLSVILFLVAFLLMSNWQRANQRIVQRLLTRMWGPRAAMNRREKFFAGAVRDGLKLIAIAFLALGALEFLSATVGY
jgi:hypothetical protein